MFPLINFKRQRFSRRILIWRNKKISERKFVLILSFVVGALSGLAAVLFLLFIVVYTIVDRLTEYIDKGSITVTENIRNSTAVTYEATGINAITMHLFTWLTIFFVVVHLSHPFTIFCYCQEVTNFLLLNVFPYRYF